MKYQGADRRMETHTDFKFEIHKIESRLEALSTKLEIIENGNNDTHEVLSVDLGVIGKDLITIKRVLLGNGKTGFFSKVNILWGGSVFIISALVLLLIRSFLL